MERNIYFSKSWFSREGYLLIYNCEKKVEKKREKKKTKKKKRKTARLNLKNHFFAVFPKTLYKLEYHYAS